MKSTMGRKSRHVTSIRRAGILISILWLIASCATIPKTAKTDVTVQSASTPTPVAAQPSSTEPPKPPLTGAPEPAKSPLTKPPETPKPPATQPAVQEPAPSAPATQPAPTPAKATTTSHAPLPPSPSLSAEEINRGIFAYGGKDLWPVSNHGRALHVGRKPSPAGTLEIFAVFAAVANESDAEVATISDFSRLFKEDLTPVKFSLVQFREAGGGLREVQSFPLGDYLVFESLKIVPIKKGADLPFAVSVTFQTQEGSTDDWVTFSKEGTSQISLHQTLSRSPIIEDIDNDGYLDIIIRERGIEEGTGYETFLTWYKWDGVAYKEYKTTNIVRNLREFLDHAATLIENDQLQEFFQTSLRTSTLSSLQAEGLSGRKIFTSVFHLVPSSPDNPNDPIDELGAIDRVIFPNIFENPFTGQDRHGYSFPMTVRFVTTDEVSHFYHAKVYMHRNPFLAPQFSFAAN